MTLDKYTHRLVAMAPDTTAYDAIRAMEDNHIGAVVVQENGEVMGVVTDRDLAVQIISFDQDPLETPLGTLMSKPVQVVQIEASAADAARLMLDRHVRRLPILSGAKLVGILTLDDLIADRAVEPELVAQIVRAQLAEPARLKFAGQRGPGAPVESPEKTRVRTGTRGRVPHAAESRRGIARQLRQEVATAFRRIIGG
ncbi:MAG TPA: CBS domain-containing protein [Polyangiaceae bacterium]|nr:CBS domain-containing protein [Polyangiaceae bacterium]